MSASHDSAPDPGSRPALRSPPPWELVAAVPIVATVGDYVSERFFATALLPKAVASGVALVSVPALLTLVVVGRRWRRLEVEVRTETERRLAELEARTTEQIEAAERRARVKETVRAGEQLEIAYQPVRDLATRTVVGYEALARFPTGTPHGWFCEAHELGIGVELEILAARRAIEGFDAGYGRLAVNFSPQALAGEHLHELFDLEFAFEVVLEITEHQAVADYEHLVEVLRPYRERGVLIAIDDAGAGYASFRHVLGLRPDSVKLDRSIIAGLDGDMRRRSLVESLARFADRVGIRLVAEGIETESELAACLEVGVRFGQGYLLGRPGPLPGRTGRWVGMFADLDVEIDVRDR